MEQVNKVRTFLIALLLIITGAARGQGDTDISLFTDRELYASGETVLFKIFLPDAEKSAVVKIVLTETSGKIISEVNKQVESHQANGYVYLPDSLVTGSYLLCASTKINPYVYVKELFVCNRFNSFQESSVISVPASNDPVHQKPADDIRINGLNLSHRTRENIKLTLQIPPELLSQLSDNLSVYVAAVTPGLPPGAFRIKAVQNNRPVLENEGLTLEGNAIDPKTGGPFKNGCIMLSVPDSIPRLEYVMTGEDGTFCFRLPGYTGRIPAIVQGIDPEKRRVVKIRINQVDTLRGIIPSFEMRQIPREVQVDAGKVAEAATLQKIFKIPELNYDTVQLKVRKDYAFYGMPIEVVHPDQFYDLPNFTEISREILPGVRYKANNRIPTLQMLNPSTLNYIDGQPFVVLDGVPVFDLDIIRNLGSPDIRRIEVCRKERYYGDLYFPGVLAIYTTKPDYSLFKESYDLVKLTINTFQSEAELNIHESKGPNEPDLRNVLVWLPRVNPGETVPLEISTSDIGGTYRIVVYGKSKNGSIVYKEQNFEVK